MAVQSNLCYAVDNHGCLPKLNQWVLTLAGAYPMLRRGAAFHEITAYRLPLTTHRFTSFIPMPAPAWRPMARCPTRAPAPCPVVEFDRAAPLRMRAVHKRRGPC